MPIEAGILTVGMHEMCFSKPERERGSGREREFLFDPERDFNFRKVFLRSFSAFTSDGPKQIAFEAVNGLFIEREIDRCNHIFHNFLEQTSDGKIENCSSSFSPKVSP